MAGRNREWASLTCASDRFDIDCGRARCHCTTADFAAVTDADVVVVVPAACRRASSMIAYAAVPAGRGGGRCSVEVAVSRASARCARPYRFAYVDGRRYGVMAVSAPFAFDHRGGPCDCDTSPGGGGGGGAADAGVADGRDSRAGETAFGAPDRLASATVRGMSAFVSSLMDTRFGAPRCPACNVPANHGQVLEHLRTSADRLRRGTADVKKECSRQAECLNKCRSLLEHHKIKTNILYAEMEDDLRFANGLISSLLKNHKASFWTGNDTIFLKIEKTREMKKSANQRFMHSIIISQNEVIDQLTATYKEILIMINTMQLFAKVL